MTESDEDNKDHWLSTTQAGDVVGVSGNTIARWCKQGRVEHFETAGGHKRIRRSEAETIRREGARPRRTARVDCGGDGGKYCGCDRCREEIDALYDNQD